MTRCKNPVDQQGDPIRGELLNAQPVMDHTAGIKISLCTAKRLGYIDARFVSFCSVTPYDIYSFRGNNVQGWSSLSLILAGSIIIY